MNNISRIRHTIRAVTFDLDDTLWDNRPVLLAAERALYDWLAQHYPRITASYSQEDLQSLRQSLLEQQPELAHDVTRLRKVSLQIAAESAGYDRGLVEPAFSVFIQARHRLVPYDDVTPALRALRNAGYCLGSLSNGNADVQRLPLGKLFDFSLSAACVGRAKPHPRMFEEACRRAGVSATELAHVGDEADTDLAGGHAAGVTVIWMNRRGQPPVPHVSPHAEVRDMAQLLTLLGVQ